MSCDHVIVGQVQKVVAVVLNWFDFKYELVRYCVNRQTGLTLFVP